MQKHSTPASPRIAKIPNTAADATSTQLLPFQFETHEVRVHVDQEGNPWWEAHTVVPAIGLKADAGQHVHRLEDDEKTLISNQGGGHTWLVNESGLYTLILGTRKKEAKAFKRWITHEVLPSIRRTGKYALGQAAIDRPLTTTKALLHAVERLVELEDRVDCVETALADVRDTVKAIAERRPPVGQCTDTDWLRRTSKPWVSHAFRAALRRRAKRLEAPVMWRPDHLEYSLPHHTPEVWAKAFTEVTRQLSMLEVQCIEQECLR
ncbi:MAG TPA: BRO family protein [Candidatus Tectomicrobia bacterium]|jgi:prophage antirepressor-like protein